MTAGRRARLLAIGEVMAEIRSSGDGGFAMGFAGDTYNTAVYAARALGTEGEVAYLTRVGTEPLSAALMDRAAEEGIDVSHVAVDPDRNIGIYSVSTDAHGERSFHYWRADSAARRADGALIAFDSNFRPKLWEDAATARTAMQALWDIADIALPSIDDEMALFGDASEEAVVERFAARSWRGVAIKRGVRGPISPNLAAEAHPNFPPATSVIDTTAAGDSFNGGYFAAFLDGGDEASRLAAGHSLASRVVGTPGAIIPRDQS